MPGLHTMLKRAVDEHRAKKRVRLSRSLGGTVVIFLFLIFIGAFMALPIIYSVLQSL